MPTESHLTLALPRGRPWTVLRGFLERAGVPGVSDADPDRQLVWESSGYRLLFTRPADVVTYVREGTADLGVTGKDTLLEDSAGVYELEELPVGGWRLSLAQPSQAPPWPTLLARLGDRVRVATSYPVATAAFFGAQGISPQIVRLRGAVELAPVVGMADCIVDMVETGGTLRAHGLIESEVIMPISLRLIGNQRAHRWKREAVADLLQRIRDAARSERREKEGVPWQAGRD